MKANPREISSLVDILSSLSALESDEAQLSSSLSQLLSARDPIISSLSRLQSLVPKLQVLSQESLLLSNTVSATAQTAQRVGGRVRSLDEEMKRVREAGDRVAQVMDLKSSLNALQSSIEAQDWESATRHCARAMSLPLDVISGPFAESTVPTAESHLPPVQTLEAAREQLLDIFHRNFDQASQSRDSNATSRFFKLFPAIGWEKEGLEAYAAFVVDLVRVRSPSSAKTSSPMYYITALTALFESIAMIVDQHQPVVEKYYGPGKMNSVIQRLLEECDRVVKGLLEAWEEERSMKRKLTDVSASTSTTSRRQPQPSYGAHPPPEDDPVDPRDIDKVLSEMAGMSGRWNLFKKFLTETPKNEETTEDQAVDDQAVDDQAVDDVESTQKQQKVSPNDALSIESTASYQIFEHLLTTYYVPMEIWYIRTIIDKAHRLSTPDTSASPPTTTTPDDVFYILSLVLTRILSTGSLPASHRALDLLRDVVEREYAGVIKRKLDEVYRGSGSGGGGGGGGGSRGEKAEREMRFGFIILLNDLDVSSSHMERLSRDLLSNPTIPQHYAGRDQATVKSYITSLGTLVTKFRSILRLGIEQLFNQLLRPKLRTLIADVYKDVSYVLDDDAYSAAEYADVVRKRFVKAWESLVDGYKDTFTDGNYRLLFGLALDALLRPWEKTVMTFKFTELGAIRFDRDLRSITTHLSSQTAFGDAREKFVRLQQISTLLNLDSEEDVEEFYNGSGIAWKLSVQEARVVAGLKV